MAWEEYCAEYWLNELQESMDRCTGCRNITEIQLKTALHIISFKCTFCSVWSLYTLSTKASCADNSRERVKKDRWKRALVSSTVCHQLHHPGLALFSPDIPIILMINNNRLPLFSTNQMPINVHKQFTVLGTHTSHIAISTGNPDSFKIDPL